MSRLLQFALVLLLVLDSSAREPQKSPPATARSTRETKITRARDLGIPFDGIPGPLNAITDVAGVEVGYTTLISGAGKSAVRTGVTAILTRGKKSQDPVFGGWFTLNGNGEM